MTTAAAIVTYPISRPQAVMKPARGRKTSSTKPAARRTGHPAVQAGRGGVLGGASYDGLVALEAAAHGRALFTLDQRARATYRRLGMSSRAIDT